jgi:hypothetical protein
MLSKKCAAYQSFDTSKYLIPWFDGVIFSVEWKEAFWDKWTTGAPRTVPHSPTNLRDRDGSSPWICVRSGPRTPNSAARTSNDGVPTCFLSWSELWARSTTCATASCLNLSVNRISLLISVSLWFHNERNRCLAN